MIMHRLGSWLDQRLGWRRILEATCFRAIPGGPKWRYVWGSTLLFTFLSQMITGFCLWTMYSPSSQTAWESIAYLEAEIPGGWFLRGLHHYSAQAFVLLLAIHVIQMVLYRAYRSPRELAWWLVLALIPVAVGMSVTGWMLPFDQKGYWAARVPLNIVGITPVVGPWLQSLVLGGSDVTHHTLTRFLALHAGLLPLGLGLLLLLHLALAWRTQGKTEPPSESAPAYWPHQAWLDALACLALMVIVAGFVVWRQGAGLGAPANPAESYDAARPEWFFLFLFQFLKFFPGGTEVWGAIIIPSLILLVFIIMPWTGRRTLGQVCNVVFVLSLLLGAIGLTWLALKEDAANPHYATAVETAAAQATRARDLAASPLGIPPEGALAMLRRDPLSRGPHLFARHCASCHRYRGHDGLGHTPEEDATAADLGGFASRDWLTRLLDPAHVDGPDYFGGTRFKNGKMVRFVQRTVDKMSDEEQIQLQAVIAAVSAEAALPRYARQDAADQDRIEQGRVGIASEAMRCTECHKFHEHDDDPSGPDLTGYGSRDWLVHFIGDPAAPHFYAHRNDRMPRFAADQILDAETIGVIADWLREDWYRPDGAATAPRP